MNKPAFKTAGIMAAAATFTTVIFARTKPPASGGRDGDGKAYKSLTLGKRAWMAERPNYNAGNGSSCFAVAFTWTCSPRAAYKTKRRVA
jgi:hypothetical protein